MMVFTDKQCAFLENEFKLTRESIGKMDTAALEELYNEICQIEIEETVDAGDNELTARGKNAVELVDIMAEALGYIPDNIDKEWEEFQNEE